MIGSRFCVSTVSITCSAGSNSAERQALLREAEALVEEFHARVVRTGFEQWFADNNDRAIVPPAWKQNMVVLLMLYPVVFLFGLYVQTPLLIGWAGLPFWAALFLGNVASVLLLNWLVPWASRALSWWLNPLTQHRLRVDLGGAVFVAALYAVCLYAFSRV